MKLVDVLKPGYIKIPLEKNLKEDVIRELIEVLSSQQLFKDKEAVFAAILDREKIMTTGIGREVAIPHCKKNECKDFAIALGIHYKGIDFNSIDNKPVKIVFLLVGPEENPGMHIRLLSRISRLISKEQLRENLLKVSTTHDAYRLLKNEEEKYFEITS
jgi:fructose-specific phosphotransferase system IIA component